MYLQIVVFGTPKASSGPKNSISDPLLATSCSIVFDSLLALHSDQFDLNLIYSHCRLDTPSDSIEPSVPLDCLT